jgi:hypothetical protein
MTLTLRPETKYPTARLILTRNGRKVGTITMLEHTLWVAALDDPPSVIYGHSLADLRARLRGK